MIKPTFVRQSVGREKSARSRGLGIAIVGMACRLPGIANVSDFWAQSRGKSSRDHDLNAELQPTAAFLDTVYKALEDAGVFVKSIDSDRIETFMGVSSRTKLDSTDLDFNRWLDMIGASFPELSRDEIDGLRSESSNPSASVLRAPVVLLNDGPSVSLSPLEPACRSLLEQRADCVAVGAVEADPSSRERNASAVLILRRVADAEREGNRIYSVIQAVGVAASALRAVPSASARRVDHRHSVRRAYRLSGIDPSTVELLEGEIDASQIKASLDVFGKTPLKQRAWVGSWPAVAQGSAVAGLTALMHTSLSIHHRLLPTRSELGSRLPVLSEAKRVGTLFPSQSRPWIRDDQTQPRRAAVNAQGIAGSSLHVILEEPANSVGRPGSGHMDEWDSEAVFLDAPDRSTWIELAQALIEWLKSANNLDVPLKDLAFTLNKSRNRLSFRVGMVVESTRELQTRLEFVVGKLSDPTCRSIRDHRGTYFWQDPIASAGKVAFVFPGEGSQYPGMLADLACHFPEVLESFETSDRIAAERGHARHPSEEVFRAEGDEDSGLFSTVAAVNVVLTAQLALLRLVSKLGVRPEATVGHSSGEFMAMVAAGIFPADAELEERLGRLGSIFESLDSHGSVPKASLLAVSTHKDIIASLIERLELKDDVSIPIDNCPHQVVVAGPRFAIDRITGELRKAGIVHEILPFDRAYHTPRFESVIGPIMEFFQELPMRRPLIPIYSCTTSKPMPVDVPSIRRLAINQWVAPVAFRSTVESMFDDGIRIFVEVGVRGNLTGFIDDILRDKPHLAIASNLPRRSGMTQLNHLAATLHAQGLQLETGILYARRSPKTVDFSRDLPARPEPLTTSPVSLAELGRRVRSMLLNHLVPKTRRLDNSVDVDVSQDERMSTDQAEQVLQSAEAESDRLLEHMATRPAQTSEFQDAAFLSYLKTMDEFLETQRAVVEAYLNQPPDSPRRLGPDRIHDLPTEALPEWDFEPTEIEPQETQLAEASKADGGAADDIESILLEEVGRRTGYPREMLGLDLDLEADLGIDSIKRVEILSTLCERTGNNGADSQEQLSRCRTLKSIVENFSIGAPRSKTARPQWIGEVDEWVAGKRFAGKRVLDAETDPIAAQHTLGGRRISQIDRDRLGKPVVPFTVMVEFLAQAAAVLDPSKGVKGFRDVRANRWIPYRAGGTTLELRAEIQSDSEHVHVQIWDRAVGGDAPSVEGFVILGDRPTEPQSPAPFQPGDTGPCRFQAQELYDDQWLFHGPALQALKRVGLASSTSIEGSLEVLPRRELLPASDWPILHTDPIVLDAFTHLLGCWGLDKRAGVEGELMFPLRMGRLDLFSEDPPEGSEILCRIQVREVTRHQVRVDAELIGPEGRTWVRIKDWCDWRFYWPERFRDVSRNPQNVLIGRPFPLDGLEDSVAAVWIEPPTDMLRPVWGEVMEWIHFSPDARRRNEEEFPVVKDRLLAQYGKIAAKEGARRLWLRHGRDPVYPADIEIEQDSEGWAFIRSQAGDDAQETSIVAFASLDGVGIGLASLDPTHRPGVGLETIARTSDEPASDETALIETRFVEKDDRHEWHARFRAAKQAFEQSSPMSRDATSEIVRVDWSNGVLTLRDSATSDSVRIHTARRDDKVWAYTLGERMEHR